MTGQDEPPADSPPVPGESTVTKRPRPSGEEPMEPDARRRMRGNTQTVSTDQTTAPPSNANTDTAQQEKKTSRGA